MDKDSITAVEIDSEGRLHVVPATRTFPHVYREAMEVSWDPGRLSLHSPVPRDWPYSRWLEQILAAASAQGVRLIMGPSTRWLNVPPDLRIEFSNTTGQDA